MTCKCGKPTRDDAYSCEDCLTELAKALGDVPWLDEQLEITLTRQQATRYEGRTSGTTEPPLPLHWGASEARTHLRALLVSWVLFMHEEGVASRGVGPDFPEDTLPSMSRWLLNRVDGLAFHDIAGEAVSEIVEAVQRARRVIDTPPERWFAGPCDECKADLYARPGRPTVACGACGLEYDVQERREWLLAEAEHHNATTSEIARAVTVLGEYQGESNIANRIRQWAHHGRIAANGHVLVLGRRRPTYRIGDVLDCLAKDAATRPRNGAPA